MSRCESATAVFALGTEFCRDMCLLQFTQRRADDRAARILRLRRLWHHRLLACAYVNVATPAEAQNPVAVSLSGAIEPLADLEEIRSVLPRAKPPVSGGRADEWQSRADHAMWLATAQGIDERRAQWRRALAAGGAAGATGAGVGAKSASAAAAASTLAAPSSSSASASATESDAEAVRERVGKLAWDATRELLQFAIAAALVQSAQVLDAVRLSSLSSSAEASGASTTVGLHVDAASAAAASLLTRIHELSTGGWAGVSESVFANFLLPRALLHHQLGTAASGSNASAALSAIQPAVDLLESVLRTESRVAALLRLSASRANTLVYEVQRPIFQRLVAGHSDRLSDQPISAFTNARFHAAFAADVGTYLLDAAMALLPWMATRTAAARHKEVCRLNASAALARTRFAFHTLFAHHAALRAGVVGVYADLVARSLRHLLALSGSAAAVNGATLAGASGSNQYSPMAVAHALLALWTGMHELPVLLWPACGAPVRAAFEEVCVC